MTEQHTTEPQSTLDKFFAALRGIDVRRRTDDKWIAGVCSGLADRLGIDPVIVRGAMVLLLMLGGMGLAVYLVAWALLPNDKDELAVEQALRDGDGGSIVLIVIAALMVFGGSWWGGGSGWGFPWGLALFGLLVWWLVTRSQNKPVTDQRLSTQQSGSPYSAGPSPTPLAAGSPPTPLAAGSPPTPFAAGPSPTPFAGPPPTAARPMVPQKPRRRSGGALMALLAIGLALVTYGSLSWLGTRFDWAGDHATIALAGSLAAIGLLLVALGLAGWRAGFVAFLAVVLAITAFSSTAVPDGINLGGPVGNATWTPALVVPGASYRLGAGDGVLDLSGLPTTGLSDSKITASVGLGELTVLVPEGLTVEVRGHVGLGEISLPSDAGSVGQGGTDISKSDVVGDGTTEVVVDAGVGIGQLTVVKE